MSRSSLLLLLVTILALPLAAQNVSSTLNGTVRDSSGAVVPGATVTLTNDQTGATRVVQSNAEGYFVFAAVLPGAYSVTVEMAGFKTYRERDIRLNAGDIRALGDVRLQVGQVAEAITVDATALPVELGSGEKSGVFTGDEIERTAIRGRDFLDMLRLMPGVVDTTESRESPGPWSIQGIFINGARDNQKNVTVDGVSSMDTGSNSTTHFTPSITSIAEVKVLTSNYQAEFGRNSGGTIIVITKGGTQQYHGSASWFYRHESLSANDYFNNRNNVKKPPYRYNIGNWSVGGPVFPKNRKTARLFFFFSQEFTRQMVNFGTRTVRVPNLLERQGDFTQTFDVNNALIRVYDPLTAQQFPGNIIPKDRQNKIGQGILNMFPKPNFVDSVASRVNQWNYIVSASGPYPRRQEVIRIDYNPTPRWQTYVRYTQDADKEDAPYTIWGTGAVNYDLGMVRVAMPGRGLGINVTRAIGASFMNQLIFGYSTNRVSYYPLDLSRMTKAGLGVPLPSWRPQLNPLGLLPSMTFAGVPNYANPSMHNGAPHMNNNHIFSIVENLSKIHGKHTVRGGVYVERSSQLNESAPLSRGSISFNDDGSNPLRTRYAYASALLGIVTSYAEATNKPVGMYRFTNLEWYLQDNWRVNRRLAIDYGLRFYHDLPLAEDRGQTAAFVPQLWNPARAPMLIGPGRDANGARAGVDPVTGRIYSAGLIGTYVPGVGDPALAMVLGGQQGFPKSLFSVPGLSLGPRFGFAFDPVGKGRTALRGGIGIFYDRIMGQPTMSMITNPPTVFTPTVYYTTLDDLVQTASSGLLAPTNISTFFGKGHMPSTLNYSFGIQQALGRNSKLDVGYVGSVSRHLIWQRNINPVPIGARFLDLHPENRDPTTNAAYSTNFLRLYRAFGDISMWELGGTSAYNSLQVAFMQRLEDIGLQTRISYTFAKALGTAISDYIYMSPFLKPREWNYGRLFIDRDHLFTMNYTWTAPGRWLPANRWLRAPLEHWEFTGTTMLSAGTPFTPGFSTVDGMDFTGTPSESARMIWLGGNNFARPALPRQPGTPSQATFGNMGTTILRGPGINNWDIRIARRFPLFSEKRSLEFRSELYNFPNHTQFSAVDQTARFDQAGNQINSLFLQPTRARSPRRIQLALKVYF